MKRVSPQKKLGRWALIGTAAAFLLTGCSRQQFAVLNPVGPVGRSELQLIILSTILVLVVIVPVIALLAYIVFRYRDKPGNRAPYQPEWSESRLLEFIWWSIPIVIVAILGVVTAEKIFALTRPPESVAAPLTVKVQSLDWKWLFQYSGQKIATLNYLEIPTGQPIQFILTSNAPMNSFWVPQLGGMEYTMPGTQMRLWLQADKPGTYLGRGANFTGTGFAHMTFSVVATSTAKFDQWVQHIKQTGQPLTNAGYRQLVKPGLSGRMSYSSYPAGLFGQVVRQDSGVTVDVTSGS